MSEVNYRYFENLNMGETGRKWRRTGFKTLTSEYPSPIQLFWKDRREYNLSHYPGKTKGWEYYLSHLPGETKGWEYYLSH